MYKHILFLTVIVFLGVACIAGAADRKVIIGFRKSAVVNEEGKHRKFYRLGGHIKHSHKLINAISGQLPEEEIAKIKKDPDVAYVEADVELGITEPDTVLPPLTQEYTDSWGVTRIGGNFAAAGGITGAGVKVAVLDSGIDYNHPDLKDNYKGGYNVVYGTEDPYDDGYISHGTHIAGIIGARDNGTGVVGVAPEASLYAVKVLGGMLMGALSDILAGMEWAIENKMDIINLSIEAKTDSEAFRDTCDRAYQAGIIVVAAGGNSKSNVIAFPAAYESVIAVAATSEDDTFAAFSNFGEKIELAAPGVNIKSTLRGGGYGTMKGTSQAAAHVSGAAAILLAKELSQNKDDKSQADNVRELLDSSATDLGDAGRDQYFGFGIVNLAKALTPPPPPVTWKYSITMDRGYSRSRILTVPLDEGEYKIDIELKGLRDLQIIVRDSNGVRRINHKPERHRFYKKRDNQANETGSTFNISIASSGSLLFIPEGRPGSSADIVVTAK